MRRSLKIRLNWRWCGLCAAFTKSMRPAQNGELARNCAEEKGVCAARIDLVRPTFLVYAARIEFLKAARLAAKLSGLVEQNL